MWGGGGAVEEADEAEEDALAAWPACDGERDGSAAALPRHHSRPARLRWGVKAAVAARMPDGRRVAVRGDAAAVSGRIGKNCGLERQLFSLVSLTHSSPRLVALVSPSDASPALAAGFHLLRDRLRFPLEAPDAESAPLLLLFPHSESDGIDRR